MDMGLNNKTALVTGSTKGIGKAIAIELAEKVSMFSSTDEMMKRYNEPL